MHEIDRFKQLHGPYRMPRYPVGSWLRCRFRGQVQVTGISDSKIPWPETTVGGHQALIFCGGLVDAVRRESALAIRHWWRYRHLHRVAMAKGAKRAQVQRGQATVAPRVDARAMDHGAAGGGQTREEAPAGGRRGSVQGVNGPQGKRGSSPPDERGSAPPWRLATGCRPRQGCRGGRPARDHARRRSCPAHRTHTRGRAPPAGAARH